MTSTLLVLLLAACGRVPGCVDPPEDPALSQPIEAPRPQAEVWPHRWRWAAVVRVDATIDQVLEIAPAVGVPPADGAAPADASPEHVPTMVSTSPGIDILRDALADRPVSLWTAPPGATLSLPGGAPEVAGQQFLWTVPADAAQDSWLVATDLGVHTLAWGDEVAVRETFVALGLEPWRVIVSVGMEDQLGVTRDLDVVQMRMQEHGVIVVTADGTAPLAVPWQDAPLDILDLPGVLSGRTEGYVVATQGQVPRLVQTERPLAVLKQASAYFGVELLPQVRGGGGRGKAKAGAGKAAKAKAGRGKAGRGKAGQHETRRGEGPGPAQTGEDAAAPTEGD